MRTFLIFTTTIILLTVNCFSESQYMSQIPNGSKFSCNTCHIGSNYKSFNSFGAIIKSSYMSSGKVKWGAALAKLDSDGDGITNGAELQDPNGAWTIGSAQPGTSSLVTNPGDKTSFTGIEELYNPNGMITVNSIYPNPIAENSQISLTFKEGGFLRISLLNAEGKNISSIFNANISGGEFYFNIMNGINLPSGLYFIRINLDNYSIIEKIIIL